MLLPHSFVVYAVPIDGLVERTWSSQCVRYDHVQE